MEGPGGEGAEGRGRRRRTWTASWRACARRPRASTRSSPVPRPHGDFAVLDVQFTTAEGKPRHDENVLVEVGAADNHKELNEALVGMAPGETRVAHVVVEPAQQSPPKAERAVDYTVTLKAIKKKVVPAPDDEFAKDLGDFDSLAALRDDRAQAPARRGAERRSTAR